MQIMRFFLGKFAGMILNGYTKMWTKNSKSARKPIVQNKPRSRKIRKLQ